MGKAALYKEQLQRGTPNSCSATSKSDKRGPGGAGGAGPACVRGWGKHRAPSALLHSTPWLQHPPLGSPSPQISPKAWEVWPGWEKEDKPNSGTFPIAHPRPICRDRHPHVPPRTATGGFIPTVRAWPLALHPFPALTRVTSVRFAYANQSGLICMPVFISSC